MTLFEEIQSVYQQDKKWDMVNLNKRIYRIQINDRELMEQVSEALILLPTIHLTKPMAISYMNRTKRLLIEALGRSLMHYRELYIDQTILKDVGYLEHELGCYSNHIAKLVKENRYNLDKPSINLRNLQKLLPTKKEFDKLINLVNIYVEVGNLPSYLRYLLNRVSVWMAHGRSNLEYKEYGYENVIRESLSS